MKKDVLNLLNISLRCHHKIAHMIEDTSFHFWLIKYSLTVEKELFQ